MSSRFTEFKNELLLALVEEGWNKDTPLEPEKIAKKRGMNYQVGWVRDACSTLSEQDYLRTKIVPHSQSIDGIHRVTVTGLGVEAADKISQKQGGPLTGTGEGEQIITVDPSSEEYQASLQKLDELIEAIRRSNDYPDTEDKEQRQAELEAGKALLESTRIRLDAFVSVVVKALKWLVQRFADHLIGHLAGATLTALAICFGVTLS